MTGSLAAEQSSEGSTQYCNHGRSVGMLGLVGVLKILALLFYVRIHSKAVVLPRGSAGIFLGQKPCDFCQDPKAFLLAHNAHSW